MTAADTFHFRSRGLLRPVETPGPVLRTPPRQPKLEVIMSRSDEETQVPIFTWTPTRPEMARAADTPSTTGQCSHNPHLWGPHVGTRYKRIIEAEMPRPDMAQTDSAARLWDGWPSDASDAWIDAGKPTPRPVPRNPWPLVGLIIVVASAAVGGYALWRVAVEIW